MKKLIAICAFLALPFAFGSCSSDDNTVKRNESDYAGTWVTDELSYTLPGADKPSKHKFKDFPGPDAVIEDIMVLTKDKATLTETKRDSGVQPAIQGIIDNDKIITWDSEDPRHTKRTILDATDTVLRVVYDIDMRGANLPVTVTYLRK
ncbi:hypothetical protein [Myroides sp. DW712]|uniref:hypothetical protein n=1 Tax=Myroides sp. DW712 TaxID=3389800 RepID=UPI003979BD23